MNKHKHRCPDCGFVWEHTEMCAWLSPEIFDDSHTCPHCGKPDILNKYWGPEQPKLTEVCKPSGIYAI